MQLQLATHTPHVIQSYSDKGILLNDQEYTGSVILSPAVIIPYPSIHSLKEVSADYTMDLLKGRPKIVLLGHQEKNWLPMADKMHLFHEQNTALECMSIGAACRTYNILLEEGREVVLGLIFA